MTVSLAALPKGHEFEKTRFEITPEWASQYAAMVEDETIGSLPGRPYPPMALAACSIRALLDHAALPEGSIHVSQELSFALKGEPSSVLVARARIASRGERQGWVLMGIELEVTNEAGSPLMVGRATIAFPAEGGAE